MPPPRRLAASPACGTRHQLPTGPREPLARTRPRLITPSPKTDAGSGSGRRRAEVLEDSGLSCSSVFADISGEAVAAFSSRSRVRRSRDSWPDGRAEERGTARGRHAPPATISAVPASLGAPYRAAGGCGGKAQQTGCVSAGQRPPAGAAAPRPPGRGQGGPRRPSRPTCLRRGRTPGPTGTRECVTCANERPASCDICFLS